MCCTLLSDKVIVKLSDGFLISDLREHSGRHLSIITTAGNTIGIKRGKRGNVLRAFFRCIS